MKEDIITRGLTLTGQVISQLRQPFLIECLPAPDFGLDDIATALVYHNQIEPPFAAINLCEVRTADLAHHNVKIGHEQILPGGFLRHRCHFKGFASTPFDKFAEARKDRVHLQMVTHDIGAKVIAIGQDCALQSRLTWLKSINEYLFVDRVGNSAKLCWRLFDNAKKMQ